jgi:hypothetical protein
MYPNYQKRFYSPQFSELSAVSVRRLAWSLGVSMLKAVDQVDVGSLNEAECLGNITEPKARRRLGVYSLGALKLRSGLPAVNKAE